MKHHKIGWQKYEDYLEKQLSSPMLDIISEAFMSKLEEVGDTDGDMEDDEIMTEDVVNKHIAPLMIPMSPKLIEDAALLSAYECWLGHTTFDITPEIKKQLDMMDGVEILKICSRYRFFIGIGRMFNFKEVRKQIENNIIPN